MVARPKRSIKKNSLDKLWIALKSLSLNVILAYIKQDQDRKPKKLPKISDLLYRPKRDKDGNIIKPRPKNPKLPKDRKPPKAIPLKSRKPKKS